MRKYTVSSNVVEQIIRNAPEVKKKDEQFNWCEVLSIDKGFISDYLKYAEPLTDAPVLFHFVCSLVILSAILNKKVFLPYCGQPLYPNIYAVILAPSSLFRKSTSINIAKNIVQDVEEDLVLANDITYEKMVQNLSGRSWGLICWNEMGGVLEVMSKDYNSGLRALITELFDCPGLWKRELKSGTYRIEEPCVSILGASTMDWLIDALKGKDIRGGFLPRFIIIPAVEKEKSLALPPGPNKTLRDGLIRTLNEKSQITGEMHLEKAGIRIYEDWYRKHEKDLEESDKKEILSGFYSRLATYVLKLAMIFQLSYSKSIEIESETLMRACKLVDCLKGNLAKFIEEFIISSKVKEMNNILRIVKEHPGIDYSKLLRNSHLLAKELRPILDTLEDSWQVKKTCDNKYYVLRRD